MKKMDLELSDIGLIKIKNKCPTCKNCIKASFQIYTEYGEGFNPVTMKPKKRIKQTLWEDTYTCKFRIERCPCIQKCSHYEKR